MNGWKPRGRNTHRLYISCCVTCNDTVSAVHAVAVKICTAMPRTPRTAMHPSHDAYAWWCLLLLAPMLPRTTDEAWRALEGEGTRRWKPCQARSGEVHSDWSKVMEVRNDVLALEQPKNAAWRMPWTRGSSCPIRMACWPLLPMNWPISLAQPMHCPRKGNRDPGFAGRASLRWLKRDGTVRGVRACSSATETPLRLVFEHGVVGRSATVTGFDGLIRRRTTTSVP